MAITILIRDCSTIDGGGSAVAHVAYCAKARRLPVAAPGVFITDTRFHRTTLAGATSEFRAQFTVPVEVRNCECAVIHDAGMRADAARLAALVDDED